MAMLYDLIQTRRGKEKVVMTDQLKRVNDRMRRLRSSQRRGIGRKQDKVEYTVRPSIETDKFKEKPHGIDLSGDGQGTPRRIKWD